MDSRRFEQIAAEHGFRKVFFVPPVRVQSSLSTLVTDPAVNMEEAKTVILLIMPYAPGISTRVKEAVISAYYPASHHAFRQAAEIAQILRNEGHRAVSNVQVPLKKYLSGYGLGSFGRNSLIAIDGLGSAFHVQAILTDAVFTYSSERFEEAARMSETCAECNACIQACPTGAIAEGGQIDAKRCLRSVSESDPIPEKYEVLLENRLLGCDVCQSVCPRNALLHNGENVTVALSSLLDGQIGELRDMIGPNYARKRKLRKKAAVLAANLGRTDLLPLLERMAQSDDEAERLAARRAVKRLEGIE